MEIEPPEPRPREIGLLTGRLAVADDFDEPDDEITDLFEGSDD